MAGWAVVVGIAVATGEVVMASVAWCGRLVDLLGGRILGVLRFLGLSLGLEPEAAFAVDLVLEDLWK